jgi:hypothetical protein
MRYERTNFTDKYGKQSSYQYKTKSKTENFYRLSIYNKYDISIYLKKDLCTKKDITFLRSCLDRDIVSSRELSRINNLLNS